MEVVILITVNNITELEDFRVVGLVQLDHADDDLGHWTTGVLLHVEALHVEEDGQLTGLRSMLLALLVAQLQVRLQLLNGVSDDVAATDRVQEAVHVQWTKGDHDDWG